jgi:hypothetical protein
MSHLPIRRNEAACTKDYINLYLNFTFQHRYSYASTSYFRGNRYVG